VMDRLLETGSLEENSGHKYVRKLVLKRGMPVILTTNIDVPEGLVNGARGTIIGFEECEDDVPPRAIGFDTCNSNRPYTAHRGGGDIDEVEHQKRFIHQVNNTHGMWPRVQFQNGKQVTVFADTCADSPENKPQWSQPTRTQIPLTAGWAMTIHKARGLTLDKAVVNLGGYSQKALPYVALSRVPDVKNMKVESFGQNFEKNAVAYPEVVKFYKKTKWAVGRYN
jgi:ATP-dependent DNA helicase PIF1